MSWRRISGACLVLTGGSAAAGMIIVGFAILARYLKLPDAADTLGGASSMAMPVILTVGSILLTGRLIFGRWSQHTPTINAVAFGIRGERRQGRAVFGAAIGLGLVAVGMHMRRDGEPGYSV